MVKYRRFCPLTVGHLARDAEERDDPECDSGGHAVHVHPEADPRDAHDESGGQVALDEVEPDGPVQVELRSQAAVVTCKVSRRRQ